MNDTPSAPTQIAVLAPPAASAGATRWIPLVASLTAIFGAIGVVGGALLTIGAWRTTIDMSIDDLKKRMDKAEENQKTYIPVLIGLSKDVSFLADRARREDEVRTREQR